MGNAGSIGQSAPRRASVMPISTWMVRRVRAGRERVSRACVLSACGGERRGGRIVRRAGFARTTLRDEGRGDRSFGARSHLALVPGTRSTAAGSWRAPRLRRLLHGVPPCGSISPPPACSPPGRSVEVCGETSRRTGGPRWKSFTTSTPLAPASRRRNRSGALPGAPGAAMVGADGPLTGWRVSSRRSRALRASGAGGRPRGAADLTSFNGYRNAG